MRTYRVSAWLFIPDVGKQYLLLQSVWVDGDCPYCGASVPLPTSTPSFSFFSFERIDRDEISPILPCTYSTHTKHVRAHSHVKNMQLQKKPVKQTLLHLSAWAASTLIVQYHTAKAASKAAPTRAIGFLFKRDKLRLDRFTPYLL